MIERIKSYTKILLGITMLLLLLPVIILAFILKPKVMYAGVKEAKMKISEAIRKYKAGEPLTVEPPTDDTNYHAKVFEALATPIKKNK